VDVQVQPGEGDEDCKDGCGDAQALVVEHEHRAGLEGGDGMAGGEGIIVQALDEQRDLSSVFLQLEIIRPDTGHLGLEEDIADQQA